MNRLPNSKKCVFVLLAEDRIMFLSSVVVVTVISKILENGKIILYGVLTTIFFNISTNNAVYILK
jgi:hypothetical protein